MRIGAEMSGGLIRIGGNAGGQVGAAYRGSRSGMTDGTILVEGTAVCLSTLVLALRSDRPTRGQRVASVAFMLVALAATASLVWPYVRDELWGEWLSLTWLCLGVVEALFVNYKVLERDEVVRDGDAASVYIAVLVMAWVGSLLGNVFHEL